MMLSIKVFCGATCPLLTGILMKGIYKDNIKIFSTNKACFLKNPSEKANMVRHYIRFAY